MLEDEKPPIRSLYGLDGRSPALAGDDHFMTLMTNAAAKDCDGGDEVSPLRTIPWKLAERRMYRPLMLISGDRVPKLLSGVCNMQESLAPTLRELAAVVDSTYYSSFFLFLSWCIESLLQHSIDGDSGLDSYIGEVVENEELLTRSALVIPKRVIFWTTPYKQLYKDPALLVRVADQLVTLENLPNNESISEPLQDRVKAGILDAETKNEGLWKLYVFLSDGLFYTGPLSKLLSEHPCNIVPDEHLNCLRSAQNIVIRGLRTVWEDWEANRRTGLDLSKPASPDHFRQLLTVFRSERVKYEAYNSTLLDEVSEVAVGEYLHGEDLEKCRDIRYKYDVSMSFQEAVNNIELPVDKRELVLGIADLLQVSDKQLATQETQEFLVKLARRIETDKEFEAAISRDIGRAEKEAARGRLPIHPERLRAVYLGKLTPASLLREKTNV
ncbi:MAG: hypothetical protein DMF72_04995 [Acidobacteria bacterium]|nr:MAG: hypothetical protein DMF72_04995 [Acidobacteriota bacterium]